MKGIVVFTKNADRYNMEKQLRSFGECKVYSYDEEPSYDEVLLSAEDALNEGCSEFYLMSPPDEFDSFDRDMKDEFSKMFEKTGAIPERFMRFSEADMVNQNAQSQQVAAPQPQVQAAPAQQPPVNNAAQQDVPAGKVAVILWPMASCPCKDDEIGNLLKRYLNDAKNLSKTLGCIDIRYAYPHRIESDLLSPVDSAKTLGQYASSQCSYWEKSNLVINNITEVATKCKTSADNVILFGPRAILNSFNDYSTMNAYTKELGNELVRVSNATNIVSLANEIQKDLEDGNVTADNSKKPKSEDFYVYTLSSIVRKDTVNGRKDNPTSGMWKDSKLKAIFWDSIFKDIKNEERYQKSKEALDQSGMGWASDATYGKGAWDKDRKRDVDNKVETSGKVSLAICHKKWPQLKKLFGY